MTEKQLPKRYLVIIELESNSTKSRITDDMPEIIKAIQALSSADVMTAFRSTYGHLSGLLITSVVTAPVIRSAFEASRATTNDDGVFVIEIGSTADSTRQFSRALTWTQRR